ncbi:hypothetical protein [Microbispora sp. NBRC 16548]|uniref:hypothetical protein n=1 Tax=Microbispora sp. NBRC 16548 TaxID=3030994 RepID=UPI0024A286CD|nr:hypothetical protein [Microbispora sp. NBRC 16548]GLX09427.1 hypothetical protein Misp03_63530 [Microbispora sp. NBRC 16548]
MKLPRAHESLARGGRMLDDLKIHTQDEVAFRDRLPYVLDLLAGVTRSIDDESKGQRSNKFSAWWNGIDRSMQKEITELRHSELKRIESRTEVRVNVDLATPTPPSEPIKTTVEELTANAIHIHVSLEWRFKGGAFDDKQVIDTLQAYWCTARDILAKAEELLEG